MMYWPRPSELQFHLSEPSLRAGCEVIKADILTVDRCWRASTPDEYIPHTKTYHFEEIDQTARTAMLKNSDRLLIPEVRMLGNSHIAIMAGIHLFVLIREMADLGYISRIPFAVLPWDVGKFRFYFGRKYDDWIEAPMGKTPLVERPSLQLYGVA